MTPGKPMMRTRNRSLSILAVLGTALVLYCSGRSALRGRAELLVEGHERPRIRVLGRLGSHAHQGLLPAQSGTRNRVQGLRSAAVEEVDFGELAAPEVQFKMLSRGMLPAGQSLDRVLSEDTFALVNRRLSGLGMPIEPLRRFKPWLLALTLAAVEWQQAGFDPELGLDRHFYDRARSERKTIQALETAEFQISRFDELTMEEQDRMLAATVRQLDAQKGAVTTLADAWRAGDTATIEQLVLEDFKQEPRLYLRLLVERNRAWLAKIEALFGRPGRAFVVVGAAHLVGPDGLLAMLTARGFTVEQM